MWQRYAPHPKQNIQAIIVAENNWHLYIAGTQESVELKENSVFCEFIAILRFYRPNKKRIETIILFPWQISKDDWRQLAVCLRWRYKGESDEIQP